MGSLFCNLTTGLYGKQYSISKLVRKVDSICHAEIIDYKIDSITRFLNKSISKSVTVSINVEIGEEICRELKIKIWHFLRYHGYNI